MKALLTYILWPNPGNSTYQSPKALVLLSVCAVFIVLSLCIRLWRKKLQNPITKKLSRSWSSAAFWFGCSGLILVISRVEQISYVSMRLWWFVWVGIFLFYLFLQWKIFHTRHYQKIYTSVENDPREKYLPKKKN